MGVIDYVRQHMDNAPSSEQVVECRRCGTSLDPEVEVCSTCGGQDIVHFDI